jgi:chromosome transmission fidelity protein 4
MYEFLFQLSARSDREFRALEVCEMMAEPHTLQLAIKYACRLKYMQLAERISEVVQRKSAEQEEEEVVQPGQRLKTFVFKDSINYSD